MATASAVWAQQAPPLRVRGTIEKVDGNTLTVKSRAGETMTVKLADEDSLGLDVGTTIAKNMWVSVGYNFAGFADDDFSASRHTAQGPYIKIRIKADQDTFKDLSLDSLRPSR